MNNSTDWRNNTTNSVQRLEYILKNEINTDCSFKFVCDTTNKVSLLLQIYILYSINYFIRF